MSASNRRLVGRRMRVAQALLLLPFAALAVRAAHLSVVDRRGAERGAAQTQRVLRIAAERGAIVDRRGAELALSAGAPSVYAIPSLLPDVEAAAGRLARALGTSRGAVLERLRGRSGFVFIARWISRERAARVDALALEGVGVLEEPRRVYPYGALAAQVVGFANIDGHGVRGVEQQEEEWLRGVARALPVERDNRGRLLLAAGGDDWHTAGGDVALTLDATLQAAAEAALRRAVSKTGARGGAVIALDPRGGEVLALAELPGFDPNRFREVPYPMTRSRALLDATEPGSTLKPFLVAAALESGAITADELFDCENGALEIPGKTIRDPRPHGLLSSADILRLSSNIGAVKIARALGASAHFEMLRRFGFGEPTGSGFPDESAGLLRSWQSWRPLDQASIAYGHGMSATPMQLAAATAVLANGGTLLQPRLVAARRKGDGAWRPTQRRVERRVLSETTADAVLAMLELAVESGTGRRARLSGVRVAGKTGTAQKFDPKSGVYSADRFAAWFTGVVPADDPKLVVVAWLDEPRSPHTGGGAAAPLFAEVATAQLARLGVATAPLHAQYPEPGRRGG